MKTYFIVNGVAFEDRNEAMEVAEAMCVYIWKSHKLMTHYKLWHLPLLV